MFSNGSAGLLLTAVILPELKKVSEDRRNSKCYNADYKGEFRYTNQTITNTTEQDRKRLVDWLHETSICNKCKKNFQHDECMIRYVKNNKFKSCCWDTTNFFSSNENGYDYYNLIVDEALKSSGFNEQKRATVTHASKGYCHKCFKREKNGCMIQ